MTTAFQDIIRSHSAPLEPRATAAAAELRVLDGVRAVLFDVYGTLFISASGEVGLATVEAEEAALVGALDAVGVRLAGDPKDAIRCLHDVIGEHHARDRAAGIQYPEVNIVQVWQDVLERLGSGGQCEAADNLDPAMLAVHFEVRHNPVWPMPGVQSLLDYLRQAGRQLGIVSNAQFFTVELFPALLAGTVAELGFDSDLQFFSYQLGQAKPGIEIFRLAAESFASRRISPHEVVLVGNDMLNDIMPAQQLGMRTALFAGDARSLRLRLEDPRVEGVRPDVVLTELIHLSECVR